MTDDTAVDTAVYLYGVARGLDPAVLEGAEGVAGAPVRALDAAGLTALISTVRLEEFGERALRERLEDLDWLEATARAHHEVVDRAARAAPTAPVRIATIYRDEERVGQVLAEDRERFALVLDRIRGRSEWGVKAYAYAEALQGDDPAEPAEPAPPSPPAAPDAAGGSTGGESAGGGAEGAGTAYLRRRQSQRRRREDAGRRVTAQAQEIHAELGDHAVASRQHPAQDPRLSGHDGTQILNVAYLLDDERVEAFADAARRIDARLPGIGIELTGPWPPYSFIDTDETTPAAGRPA
ncbi:MULTISPECIES: GvpL/GvpF family gas vesicle protein [Actinomadura]|uniref:GvpL/GvpF family gas vesicle protein n=1 Tax=Actinomadura yumaensis TaxID=111807 RepID=A0ABW2CS47_9ACTN|nr:GvpL/GvpF family gas vesicle protein [Actinomadura sp. J1-007]MWK39791.1 hypothetical protein [Actinomadura sp. J1-007]